MFCEDSLQSVHNNLVSWKIILDESRTSIQNVLHKSRSHRCIRSVEKLSEIDSDGYETFCICTK